VGRGDDGDADDTDDDNNETTPITTSMMTMTTTSTTCPTSCPGSCRAEWYANTLYGSGRYGWLVHAATDRIRLLMTTVT